MKIEIKFYKGCTLTNKIEAMEYVKKIISDPIVKFTAKAKHKNKNKESKFYIKGNYSVIITDKC